MPKLKPLRGEILLFHADCSGCTQQRKTESFDTCKGCCYFNYQWNLPNMNNAPPTRAQLIRQALLKENK